MHLTIKQVARFLNVSDRTVLRWLQKNEIPAFKVNDQYRFHRSEILEWATARKMEVSPDLFAETGETASALPGLAHAMEAGGIHHRVPGHDRNSALRSVVGRLRLPDDVDRDFLTQILLAREEMASTGIGDGIAVPHVRNPIVLNVPASTITLCFLEKPIEFGALDGQPVFALFLLISQTVRIHLHLLSRLAFALRQSPTRDLIRQQADPQDILNAFRRLEAGMPASDTGEGGGSHD